VSHGLCLYVGRCGVGWGVYDVFGGGGDASSAGGGNKGMHALKWGCGFTPWLKHLGLHS
jgi:hypothetical protein